MPKFIKPHVLQMKLERVQQDTQKVYTLSQAAQITGDPRATIESAVRKGYLITDRNGLITISRTNLLRWLKQRLNDSRDAYDAEVQKRKRNTYNMRWRHNNPKPTKADKTPDGYISLNELARREGKPRQAIHQSIFGRSQETSVLPFVETMKVGSHRYVNIASWEQYKAAQSERVKAGE